MIRAGLVLVLLAAVGAGAAWFAEHPGQVAVDWSGWRIESTTGTAVVALGVLAVVSALLYRGWVWLRHGTRRLGASREGLRRRRGYRALTQGMVAVAAGDGAEAQRLARRAEALLEEPPLTMLLSAQSAQLDGDEQAAERYFRAMLTNPELEFLGLRGLLTQALRGGDDTAALEYARRAYALRPQAEWAQTTLFELQMAGGQWKGAEALLQEMGRRSSVPAETANRRRAMLLYEQALGAKTQGDVRRAVRLATKGHAVAPTFVPVAVLAAELLRASGKQRKAAAIIGAAWQRGAHPDLVAAFRDLWPRETADRRLERFAELVGEAATDHDHPGHYESNFGLARLAVDARSGDAARRYLEAATDGNPSARVCRLWAELEDAENGPGLAARDWLMKAARRRQRPGLGVRRMRPALAGVECVVPPLPDLRFARMARRRRRGGSGAGHDREPDPAATGRQARKRSRRACGLGRRRRW